MRPFARACYLFSLLFLTSPLHAGVIVRFLYDGVVGDINSVRSSMFFPNSPTRQEVYTNSFASTLLNPPGSGMVYGSFIRGFIDPPARKSIPTPSHPRSSILPE